MPFNVDVSPLRPRGQLIITSLFWSVCIIKKKNANRLNEVVSHDVIRIDAGAWRFFFSVLVLKPGHRSAHGRMAHRLSAIYRSLNMRGNIWIWTWLCVFDSQELKCPLTFRLILCKQILGNIKYPDSDRFYVGFVLSMDEQLFVVYFDCLKRRSFSFSFNTFQN